MFVGVDGYDTPLIAPVLDGSGSGITRERCDKSYSVGLALNGILFSSLKEASCLSGDFAAISKCFLTGLLPAFGLSLNATTLISADPQYHGICGLTSNQVKLFVDRYLGKCPTAESEAVYWAIRKCCGGYFFAGGEGLERVFHPELVYHALSQLKTDEAITRPGESPAVHVASLFKSVVSLGNLAMDDIVDIMSTGMQRPFLDDAHGIDSLVRTVERGQMGTATPSALGRLGVLTQDGLRIPNETMKSMVYRALSFRLGFPLN
jgi:hypothetical protein